MSHGPEHHIEHAEHASHAAHDGFDKKVTISIAIVAAVLAAVTMLGHQSHNETLRLQTEAAIQQNLATNKWGQYQAYNIRSHMYQSFKELSDFSQPMAGKDVQANEAQKRWQAQVKKYEEKSMPETKKDAEHHQEEAEHLLHKSHEVHDKAARFDLGELGLQLGVVLCSLAILTKRKTFWHLGLLCSVVGFAVAMSGQFGLGLATSQHDAHDHGHSHSHSHSK